MFDNNSFGQKPPTQGNLFGTTQNNSASIFGNAFPITSGNNTPQNQVPVENRQREGSDVGNSSFGNQTHQEVGSTPFGWSNQLQPRFSCGCLSHPDREAFIGKLSEPRSLFDSSTHPFFGKGYTQLQSNMLTPSFPSHPSQNDHLSRGSYQIYPSQFTFKAHQNDPQSSFPSSFGQNCQSQALANGTCYQQPPRVTSQNGSLFPTVPSQLEARSPFGLLTSQVTPSQNQTNPWANFPSPSFYQTGTNNLIQNPPFGPQRGVTQQQFPIQTKTCQGSCRSKSLFNNYQVGTTVKPFEVLNNHKNNKVNTITFMPEYSKSPLFVHRLKDYTQYKTNPNSIENKDARFNLDTYFEKLEKEKMCRCPDQPLHNGQQVLNPGTCRYLPNITSPSSLPAQPVVIICLMPSAQTNMQDLIQRVIGCVQQPIETTVPAFYLPPQQLFPAQPRNYSLFPPESGVVYFQNYPQVQPNLFDSKLNIQPSNPIFTQPTFKFGEAPKIDSRVVHQENKSDPLFSSFPNHQELFKPQACPTKPNARNQNLQESNQSHPFQNHSRKSRISKAPRGNFFFKHIPTSQQGLFDKNKSVNSSNIFGCPIDGPSALVNQRQPSKSIQQSCFPGTSTPNDFQNSSVYKPPFFAQKLQVPLNEKKYKNDSQSTHNLFGNLNFEFSSMRVNGEKQKTHDQRSYSRPDQNIFGLPYDQCDAADNSNPTKQNINASSEGRFQFEWPYLESMQSSTNLQPCTPFSQIYPPTELLSLTVELELYEKKVVADLTKLTPNTTLSQIMGFLVRQQMILSSEDLEKAKLFVDGENVSLESKLKEIKLSDSRVLVVRVKDKEESIEPNAEETKPNSSEVEKIE